MTQDEFEDLAAKVLTREASATEVAELELAMAEKTELRRQFNELLDARQFLTRLGEEVRIRDLPGVEIPATRLRELQSLAGIQIDPRSDTFLKKLQAFIEKVKIATLSGSFLGIPVRPVWAIVTVVALVCAIAVITIPFRQPSVAIVKRSTPTLKPNPNSTSEVLAASTKGQNASKLSAELALDSNQFLAVSHLVSFMDAQPIAVYSPRNATRNLKPVIIWRGQPGKKYAVRIVEIAPTPAQPFQITDAVSPIEFGSVAAWSGRELKKNTFYQLTIQEIDSGQTAVHTFQVLSDADGSRPRTPSEIVDHAKQLLSYDTPCTGDALVELLTLGQTAEIETAVRLKMIAFGRLGLQQEYQQAAVELKRVAEVKANGIK